MESADRLWGSWDTRSRNAVERVLGPTEELRTVLAAESAQRLPLLLISVALFSASTGAMSLMALPPWWFRGLRATVAGLACVLVFLLTRSYTLGLTDTRLVALRGIPGYRLRRYPPIAYSADLTTLRIERVRNGILSTRVHLGLPDGRVIPLRIRRRFRRELDMVRRALLDATSV